METPIPTLPCASLLADAARDLRLSYSEARALALFEKVKPLLVHELNNRPWRFREHSDAAKEVAADTLAVGKTSLKDSSLLALRILLTVRPDPISEVLPGRHHFGLAFYLLAQTEQGRHFIQRELNVSPEQIDEIGIERAQRVHDLGEQRQMLVTLEELLRSKLMQVEWLELRLQGSALFAYGPPIKLNPERTKLMELLLTREHLPHGRIENQVPCSSAARQVSRLTQSLTTRGIQLQFEANNAKETRYVGATRCEPTNE